MNRLLDNELEELDFVNRIAAALYIRRYDDSVDFEDYKHFGVIGLLEAKKSYDSEKGASFRTFASFRIKGAILNGIYSYSEKLSVSLYKRKSKNKVLNFSKNSDLNEKFNSVSSFIIDAFMDSALDELFDNIFLDEVSLEQNVNQSNVSKILMSCLDELNKKQKDVIYYHYFYEFSFQAISEILGLSKGRVSQVHSLAIKTLFQSLSSVDEDFLVYV